MTDDDEPQTNVARASAWMALGTIVSRITGFARMILLIWAIGTSLNADLFDSANTVPNAMYILVAGGIFNVVLVPQLVRTMKNDADGGDAYAQRIITLGLLVLAAATTLLMICVPWILRLVFDSALFTPGLAEQRESAQLLMYLCMPQVFFYGAFVLVGQVLNARGRFGPMMWAPIVNNVVACAVLVIYVLVFGQRDGSDGFSTSESLLLGIGSTVGIVAQAAVLVPYLRKAGFRYRPRFDFRGVGLGHTLRLGAWTLGFIAVNQVAFVIVNRLGTSGNLDGLAQDTQGSGSAVYALGFLVSQVPHGVITVSLATAVMPTLAALSADRRLERMRLELGRTIRLAMVIIVPLAVVVACLGRPAAGAISVGAARDNADIIGHVISAFALAMIAFCVHFLMLRGFYADEDTRTPFFMQAVIAVVNIAAAILLVRQAEPAQVAMMLALAYGIAYTVGATVSTVLLSRRIGPVVDHEMVRFTVRLTLASALTAAAMLATSRGLDGAGLDPSTSLRSIAILAIAGTVGCATFLLAAKLMRIEQIGYLVDTVLRRR